MRIRIISKDYIGAYELNDEFEVLRKFKDGSAEVIGNDGKEVCLWEDEFEIIQ